MLTCQKCRGLIDPNEGPCPAARSDCPHFSRSGEPKAPEPDSKGKKSSARLEISEWRDLVSRDSAGVPRETILLSSSDRASAASASPPSAASAASKPGSSRATRAASGATTVEASPPANLAARANPLAKLAKTLAVWSVIPLFPIAVVALLVSTIALSRASSMPGKPGRSDAVVSLLMSSIFAVAWLALTIWYIRDILVR